MVAECNGEIFAVNKQDNAPTAHRIVSQSDSVQRTVGHSWWVGKELAFTAALVANYLLLNTINQSQTVYS